MYQEKLILICKRSLQVDPHWLHSVRSVWFVPKLQSNSDLTLELRGNWFWQEWSFHAAPRARFISTLHYTNAEWFCQVQLHQFTYKGKAGVYFQSAVYQLKSLRVVFCRRSRRWYWLSGVGWDAALWKGRRGGKDKWGRQRNPQLRRREREKGNNETVKWQERLGEIEEAKEMRVKKMKEMKGEKHPWHLNESHRRTPPFPSLCSDSRPGSNVEGHTTDDFPCRILNLILSLWQACIHYLS